MIGAGWIARRTGIIGADTTRELSRLLTSFFYPALIFSSMTRHFDLRGLVSHWPLPAATLGFMLLGFGIGLAAERFLRDAGERRAHAFLFQCTINNYSFLPMPLVLMFWGERGVAGLIFSTLGSELAVWTLGVYALSGRQLDRDSLRHLLNPPLVVMGVALAVIAVRDLFPTTAGALLSAPTGRQAVEAIGAALRLFGGATIPVAMVVAGSRMATLTPAHVFSRLQLAVGALRLVVIPATAIGLFLILPFPDDVRRILLLVATMPSAVSSVVLSEIYGADADFAAGSVLITHLLCLFTIPVWMVLLF